MEFQNCKDAKHQERFQLVLPDLVNIQGNLVNKFRIILFKSSSYDFVHKFCNISPKSLQLAVISSCTHIAYWAGKKVMSTLNYIIYADYFKKRRAVKGLCRRSLILLPGKFLKVMPSL